MDRSDLARLSREQLISLVLRLRRPDETSRTSSTPPSINREERCDQAEHGRAKLRHEGYRRVMSEDLDTVADTARLTSGSPFGIIRRSIGA